MVLHLPRRWGVERRPHQVSRLQIQIPPQLCWASHMARRHQGVAVCRLCWKLQQEIFWPSAADPCGACRAQRAEVARRRVLRALASGSGPVCVFRRDGQVDCWGQGHPGASEASHHRRTRTVHQGDAARVPVRGRQLAARAVLARRRRHPRGRDGAGQDDPDAGIPLEA